MISSNSHPPPDNISTEMVQVVNYKEEFNPALQPFLVANYIASLGFDYHVAAIMGAQSSGKSTLLNMLFGTTFRTMDESSGRYQVTQGVWLGRDSEQGIIVMDLEGTDSRERGEDAATFERKSSLFALALAEVLIVNLWAQDVGRYNAANMSLLKTVMELDLQLFFGGATATPAQAGTEGGKTDVEDGKPRMHKTRLLFVIRDHVSSPFETLCNTLRTDVNKIWSAISKPEVARNTSVTDYFDIDFFALPHKVLMRNEFYAKGKELRRRFHEKEVFLAEYSRGVAADGFAAYAESVWETIRANRELDIPSQKEMLAHVRCEEIAREAMDVVEKRLQPLRAKLLPAVGEGDIVDGLLEELYEVSEKAVEMYDTNAFRYSTAVAEMKGADLKGKVRGDCKVLFDAQMGLAADQAVSEFGRRVNNESLGKGGDRWKKWGSVSKNGLEESLKKFDEACGKEMLKEKAEEMSGAHPLSSAARSFVGARKRVVGSLEAEMERATTEVNLGAKSHCEKTFRDGFKGPVGSVLENADQDVWERVSEIGAVAWEATAKEARGVYGAEGLGWDEEKVEDVVEDEIKPICYERALGDIKDAVGTPNNFVLRMMKRFDDSFRFDERGVPRHFGPSEDIEAIFVVAREKGEELVDLLGEIRLGGTLASCRSSARQIDDELSQPVILPAHSRVELREKLKRQAGAVFMEAKRAQEAAKITSKVPMWMIGLLVILGWNELMAVLRNPVLLLLTVVIVPVMYVGYSMEAQMVLVPAIRASLRPVLEQVQSFVEEGGQGGGGGGRTASDESGSEVSGNGALVGEGGSSEANQSARNKQE